MKIRRVVTGHDENGKAIFASDTFIEGKPHNDDAVFALIWSTDRLPIDNQDPTDGATRQIGIASPGGTVVRIVDMLPGKSSPMHRTITQDYGIVLEGEIELELDDGETRKIRAGDIVIQRGTVHAWHNRTDKVCRIAFILVDARPVEIGGKPLEEIHG
jgi:quercetin dioxygenase-like cupin family protein